MINIDSQFWIAVEDDMIELTNGCICCTINNNLADAVHRILERRDRIDYLVLENTGVADPLPIMFAFLDPEQMPLPSKRMLLQSPRPSSIPRMMGLSVSFG